MEAGLELAKAKNILENTSVDEKWSTHIADMEILLSNSDGKEEA